MTMIKEIEENQGNHFELLHSWVDAIPFSKPARNLRRDFSDGVLMAEILKLYYPRMVDIHNYASANNVNAKKENWKTLNRKVLSKIGMRLNEETIDHLAKAHQGTIEKLLLELKDRTENVEWTTEDDIRSELGKEGEQTAEANQKKLSPTHSSMTEVQTSDSHVSKVLLLKIISISRWLIAWIFFWNFFPNLLVLFSKIFTKRRKGTEGLDVSNKDDAVPHILFEQLRRESREKDNVIRCLNQKIAYLESAVNIKNCRIFELTSQVFENFLEKSPDRKSY